MAGKKERQRKLAKERYERRMARQAHRDRRTQRWIVSVIAVVVVAGFAVGGVLLASRSTGTTAAPTPPWIACTNSEPSSSAGLAPRARGRSWGG